MGSARRDDLPTCNTRFRLFPQKEPELLYAPVKTSNAASAAMVNYDDYPYIGVFVACLIVFLALLSYGRWCARKARASPFGWTWWLNRARQPALLSSDDMSALTNNLVRKLDDASKI